MLILSCSDNPRMTLDVGVFQDPHLPQMSESDEQRILESAREMLRKKFDVVPLTFRIRRRGSLADLFRDYQNNPTVAERIAEPTLAIPDRAKIRTILQKRKAEIADFLKSRYKMKDLTDFARAADYDSFANAAIESWSGRLQKLANYRMRDGQSLLREDSVRLHSYRVWRGLMKVQKEFDLILSNTILFYDEINEPYPHVIFKHAKVSGASFESPARRGALAGVSAMATVFELYSGEAYFQGARTLKNRDELDRDFINDALGGYLLAHELGHQIFWIPDVYDHPPGCLMDTSFENLEIGDGYRQLMEPHDRCPRCAGYVKSRAAIWKLQRASEDRQVSEGEWEAAIRNLPVPLDRDPADIRRSLILRNP